MGLGNKIVHKSAGKGVRGSELKGSGGMHRQLSQIGGEEGDSADELKGGRSSMAHKKMHQSDWGQEYNNDVNYNNSHNRKISNLGDGEGDNVDMTMAHSRHQQQEVEDPAAVRLSSDEDDVTRGRARPTERPPARRLHVRSAVN